MRAIILLSIVAVVAGARGAESHREQQLRAIKAQFPQHVAGKISETTDPAVRAMYFRYYGIVATLTPESLADGISELRSKIDNDLRFLPVTKTESKRMTEHQRVAAAQNLTWLKQHVKPYIARLESFQRGRKM